MKSLRINITTIRNCSIILLAGIIACLNVLFYTNYPVSMATIGFELVVLAYYFVKKDITRYIGSYLIFLCLSFEFDVIVGVEQFYGFKNFRILGVNLGIIALLPVAVLAISRAIKIKKVKNEFPRLYKFAKFILLLNFIGFLFGLVQILINDNKIQNMNNMIQDFIGVTYSMTAIPFLMIIAIVYILLWEKEKIQQLEYYLSAILIGVVISMIVSLTTGTFGRYGEVNTLLVSNVVRYVPFMVLFPFYFHRNSPKILIVFGIIGVILSLLYNASGKTIILYMMVPVAICLMLWRKKKIFSLILVLLILPVVFFVSIQAVYVLSSSSILFNSKLTQALSIVKVWDPGWLISMPLSPRFRIIEFISIWYEYLEKPWFLLLGKGYMGTITDQTGMIGTNFILDAYSINEWINGTFYGVHETMNILFLYHGLFGLAFYLYMIKFVYENFTTSPWILIGGFWFLMVYGFSVTMSAFGIAALLLGCIEIDNREAAYK